MSVNLNESGTSNSNRPYIDDEIDLFELWANIWSQRFLIVLITAIITIIGTGYAFLTTPIYKSETYLLPALSKDLKELQINVKDIARASGSDVHIDVDANKVFGRIVQNLNSWTYRRDFYDENDLAIYFSENSPNQAANSLFEDNFNNKLQLTSPSKSDQDNRYILSFEMADETRAAEWLNIYVNFVLGQTKAELITDVQSNIDQRKTELEMMISSMRNIAAKKRQDRIAELEEALALAKSIGLDNILQSQSPVPEKEYLRGTNAIKAEIEVLKQRKSDDPFIDDIRELQRYHDYLGSIKINPESVKIARIDQQASIPESPIKPNKKLIVVLSIILGGMLGVFVALIRAAVKNRQVSIV